MNDITKGLPNVPESSVDAVVADPPYGYGDEIPYQDLRQIWVSFIRESLRVLRDGGMLAFCGLDKVKTGRPEKQLGARPIISTHPPSFHSASIAASTG
jgi:tRNA G10  N-methylase Trm11